VVDPTDTPLQVRESVADTTFFVNGSLRLSNGRVEYLTNSFRIDYAYCDFDETDIMPVLEGRASTEVWTPWAKGPVYLTMYVIDARRRSVNGRGRLDD